MRPPIRLTMTRFTLNGSPETSACCADTPRQTGPTARIAAPDPYRSDGSEAFCVARHGSATITTGAHREHHNGRLTWASTTWTPRSTRSSTRQRTSSRRRRSTDRGGALGSGSGEGGQSQGNGPVEQQLALGGRQRRVAEQQVGDGADGERLLALKVRDRVEAGGLHLHGERAVLDQRLHGGGPVGVEDVRGQHGTLAVEMEAAGLYAVADLEGKQALAICTISDLLFRDASLPAAERELLFDRSVALGLAAFATA